MAAGSIEYACTSLGTSLKTDSLYSLSLETLAFEIQPPQFEEAPEIYGKSHIEELKPRPIVLAEPSDNSHSQLADLTLATSANAMWSIVKLPLPRPAQMAHMREREKKLTSVLSH